MEKWRIGGSVSLQNRAVRFQMMTFQSGIIRILNVCPGRKTQHLSSPPILQGTSYVSYDCCYHIFHHSRKAHTGQQETACRSSGVSHGLFLPQPIRYAAGMNGLQNELNKGRIVFRSRVNAMVVYFVTAWIIALMHSLEYRSPATVGCNWIR